MLEAILKAIHPRSVPMGGNISASEPGLPRAAIPEGPSGSSRPLRILVVDDNAVNLALVMHLLAKWGYEAAVAPDGAQALAALRSQRFDLVLTDVQMPQMNGIELTAAIRQREETTGEHLPIVAMTAHAMQGDRERCLEAGMDVYISKPMRSEDLFETIAALSQESKR